MREEIKKILRRDLETCDSLSMKDQCKVIDMLTPEITALIQRESGQKYTRKQVQEACANAYQRGVDNRPYIEKFDEWVEDEPNPTKSEEV